MGFVLEILSVIFSRRLVWGFYLGVLPECSPQRVRHERRRVKNHGLVVGWLYPGIGLEWKAGYSPEAIKISDSKKDLEVPS